MPHKDTVSKSLIIPPARVRYLSEIADAIKDYNLLVEEQAVIASKIYQLQGSLQMLTAANASSTVLEELKKQIQQLTDLQTPVAKKLIAHWPEKVKAYQQDFYEYKVRDKIIKQPMFTTSLSGTRVPKVVLPKYRDWGDLLRWQGQENIPGSFPFTAGVFPLKREGEDPTRMFAGEGDRNVRINVFTMYPWDNRPNVYQPLLIRLHYTVRILLIVRISMVRWGTVA